MVRGGYSAMNWAKSTSWAALALWTTVSNKSGSVGVEEGEHGIGGDCDRQARVPAYTMAFNCFVVAFSAMAVRMMVLMMSDAAGEGDATDGEEVVVLREEGGRVGHVGLPMAVQKLLAAAARAWGRWSSR